MFIVTSSHVKPYHFYTVKRIFHESYVGIKYTHTHTVTTKHIYAGLIIYLQLAPADFSIKLIIFSW